ncbi:hypothetical protein HYD_2840 [Candidatus Hydrogenosomobacter endosymbioticus]|uniref:Uncharacterized protein n=2 Tax=Candidatus Hydrogenosomobacter endosymbioticus TaxID=2558174 RepID=A0ABN6L6N0_9PROT|nr:hypothetical protein HYD_2840 [Candidatus Hydrogenosomobacter endosymbioticus]
MQRKMLNKKCSHVLINVSKLLKKGQTKQAWAASGTLKNCPIEYKNAYKNLLSKNKKLTKQISHTQIAQPTFIAPLAPMPIIQTKSDKITQTPDFQDETPIIMETASSLPIISELGAYRRQLSDISDTALGMFALYAKNILPSMIDNLIKDHEIQKLLYKNILEAVISHDENESLTTVLSVMHNAIQGLHHTENTQIMTDISDMIAQLPDSKDRFYHTIVMLDLLSDITSHKADPASIKVKLEQLTNDVLSKATAHAAPAHEEIISSKIDLHDPMLEQAHMLDKQEEEEKLSTATFGTPINRIIEDFAQEHAETIKGAAIAQDLATINKLEQKIKENENKINTLKSQNVIIEEVRPEIIEAFNSSSASKIDQVAKIVEEKAFKIIKPSPQKNIVRYFSAASNIVSNSKHLEMYKDAKVSGELRTVINSDDVYKILGIDRAKAAVISGKDLQRETVLLAKICGQEIRNSGLPKEIQKPVMEKINSAKMIVSTQTDSSSEELLSEIRPSNIAEDLENENSATQTTIANLELANLGRFEKELESDAPMNFSRTLGIPMSMSGDKALAISALYQWKNYFLDRGKEGPSKQIIDGIIQKALNRAK